MIVNIKLLITFIKKHQKSFFYWKKSIIFIYNKLKIIPQSHKSKHTKKLTIC